MRKIISKYGYELIEYNRHDDIIAMDSFGYKFKLNLRNLRVGKTPHRFMKNPFALENFNLYLSKKYPNYILLENGYRGVKSKMMFMCSCHLEKGIQYNTIDNIINNHHVCKYCSYEKMRDERTVRKDILISLCKSKSVKYIGQYTKNNETVVQYLCEKHVEKGVQQMTLTHFKESNAPCHYCKISSGELKIMNYLESNSIIYVHQMKFNDCRDKRVLWFDFYLPEYNTIIEYDGRQHFEPVRFWYGQDADLNFRKTVLHDNIKNEYCKNHQIRMIRIPYNLYNKVEEILTLNLYSTITESQETAG